MGVVKTVDNQTIRFNGNTMYPTIIQIEVKRKLTSGEIQLAELIYKDSIPYEKVWIIRGGLFEIPDTSKNAMTPFGNIHLPNSDYDKIKDFSSVDVNKIRWFIHEMAHVWQYYAMDLNVASRGILLGIKGGYEYHSSDGRLLAYFYDLNGADKNKEFKNLNIEQQADIISHFYITKYYPIDANKILGTNLFSQQNQRAYILREFLKNPNNKVPQSRALGGYYRPQYKK